MKGHNKQGKPVRIEQVIAVGLVGNKSKMQELAVKENEADILHITGTATESTTVPSRSDNGRPTTYIKGAFKGVDLQTNAEYISGQIILPDSCSGYVCAKLDEVKEPMHLDIVIRIQRSEKSIIGYKFLAILNDLSPIGNSDENNDDESQEGVE